MTDILTFDRAEYALVDIKIDRRFLPGIEGPFPSRQLDQMIERLGVLGFKATGFDGIVTTLMAAYNPLDRIFPSKGFGNLTFEYEGGASIKDITRDAMHLIRTGMFIDENYFGKGNDRIIDRRAIESSYIQNFTAYNEQNQKFRIYFSERAESGMIFEKPILRFIVPYCTREDIPDELKESLPDSYYHLIDSDYSFGDHKSRVKRLYVDISAEGMSWPEVMQTVYDNVGRVRAYSVKSPDTEKFKRWNFDPNMTMILYDRSVYVDGHEARISYETSAEELGI